MSVKLDSSTFAASLLSLRTRTAMDLTTAYRYNQNMMEYYTCKDILGNDHVFQTNINCHILNILKRITKYKTLIFL